MGNTSIKNLWDRKWEGLKKDTRPRSSLDSVSRAIFNYIKRNIKDGPAMILETGCGTGRLCLALARSYPNARVIGTDASAESIALCEKSLKSNEVPNVSFRVMDMNHLGFDDGTFDVSFCEGVLQYLPDELKGLKEMARVTRAGGMVFASVVNWHNYPHTIYKAIRGRSYEMFPEKSYKHGQLIKLFKDAGLEDIKIYGVYPGYGMQRIEGYVPLLGPILAQLMYLTAFIVDRFTGNWFSNTFGIQIVAKGVKK